ncbi:tRNA (N6-threonylcarbamoyladenosine(37)-N6)-methyltransferase TrmO [Psychrobacter lutiphocae]|uniref:tRNA (N6-threonylcarbamoyladenosine(37)-N6)-methyltransferase TrmO n=1 Tax=Psychrobacter lutiphocae TaxID=540500 RepID=UPI0003740A6B|nr:tRNA (N6-threonylcarbamoyladenosine(37)-N6)-methyltransferase TrmO [Psychrobacter lutiphocae]
MLSQSGALQSEVSIPIIGYHHSPLTQKFGLPRQANIVPLATTIEFLPPYGTPDAFMGLAEFSHLWVTWFIHKNPTTPETFKPLVRPPRLGGNKKRGLFATRSPFRPSQLGLSVVQLVKVAVVNDNGQDSVVLHLLGADMLDGTPIIDIKPYIAYSDAISDAASSFASSSPEFLPVVISKQVQQQLDKLHAQVTEGLDVSDSPDVLTGTDVELICQLIGLDPRPAYRHQETDTVCVMRYKNFDISFEMDAQQTMHIVAIAHLC